MQIPNLSWKWSDAEAPFSLAQQTVSLFHSNQSSRSHPMSTVEVNLKNLRHLMQVIKALSRKKVLAS